MCEQIPPIENGKKAKFHVAKKPKGFYFAETKRAQAVQITIEPFSMLFSITNGTSLNAHCDPSQHNTFVIRKRN